MFDKALRVKNLHNRPELILYRHERAKAAQMCGRHKDAIDDFSGVLKLSPLDDRAFFRRAWSYKALGLFLLAAEDFEKALSLRPDNKVYRLNYRAIGSIETIVLVPPGEEIIPESLKDEWLKKVSDEL
jgi:tetratricopeptide (TPR) repeat protein